MRARYLGVTSVRQRPHTFLIKSYLIFFFLFTNSRSNGPSQYTYVVTLITASTETQQRVDSPDQLCVSGT